MQDFRTSPGHQTTRKLYWAFWPRLQRATRALAPATRRRGPPAAHFSQFSFCLRCAATSGNDLLQHGFHLRNSLRLFGGKIFGFAEVGREVREKRPGTRVFDVASARVAGCGTLNEFPRTLPERERA